MLVVGEDCNDLGDRQAGAQSKDQPSHAGICGSELNLQSDLPSNAAVGAVTNRGLCSKR